ncbi:MAG: hypothetical protein MUQ76_09875, partial [Reinekea forsetii]|nr:hypothetical protein [Reinekea forsetii]
MLRLNEIKLALNHSEADLRAAICATLAIRDEALLSYSLFKRSYDARKKKNILLIYQIDALVSPELET